MTTMRPGRKENWTSLSLSLQNTSCRCNVVLPKSPGCIRMYGDLVLRKGAVLFDKQQRLTKKLGIRFANKRSVTLEIIEALLNSNSWSFINTMCITSTR